MDGDDSIHNLAEAIDSKLGVMAAGTVAVTIVTGNTSVGAAVTFPVGRFSVAPLMLASPTGTQLANNAGASCTAITTTGATVYGGRTTAGGLTVAWLAIQI
jgi:hypothetical protein